MTQSNYDTHLSAAAVEVVRDAMRQLAGRKEGRAAFLRDLLTPPERYGVDRPVEAGRDGLHG